MKTLVGRKYKLVDLCMMIEISRQGYYKRLAKEQNDFDKYSKLEELVIQEREGKSRAGLRSIYIKNNLSSQLGVNQFEEQMSLRGHALKPYRSYIKTTDSRGHHHKYDNLIAGKELNGANQVISGDITYYQCSSGLYYIFSFTDLYTLEMKGLTGARRMKSIQAEKCLRQVMKYNQLNKYKSKLIVHTDGGGQYRSEAYQKIIRAAGIRPSQAKSCFENGLAERINGVIKNEYLVDYTIASERQLNANLKQIQTDYNQKWPSPKLGYKTPFQYEKWVDELPINKRPVIKIAEIKE